MGMNPKTNRLEELCEPTKEQKALLQAMTAHCEPSTITLVRPDGSPVPEHWSVFRVGEEVVVKNYTFKIGYIGESALLLEPVGPVVIGEKEK